MHFAARICPLSQEIAVCDARREVKEALSHRRRCFARFPSQLPSAKFEVPAMPSSEVRFRGTREFTASRALGCFQHPDLLEILHQECFETIRIQQACIR